MYRSFCVMGFAAIFAGTACADFSYEQTSKITGGMMAGMMKFAGAFSKQAREPMQTTVSVKGDVMTTASRNQIHIIDLNAETMTEVDLEKKTYAVITFADMAKALEKMSEKMGQKDANVSFKADVKETGETKNINGFKAKEMILTLEVDAKDEKSGRTGAMNVWNDMWFAPNLPGYEEVKNFYVRMGQKLAWTPGMGAMAGGQQAGMMRGMSQAMKEASKMDGVPVLQVMRMSGAGASGLSPEDQAKMQAAQAEAQQQAAQQQAQQPPPPSAGSMAGQAATGAALGRMGRAGAIGGALGGFGGFGKKKKTEQQQEQQAPPPAPVAQEAPPPAGPAGATPPGTLMEMTIELTAFSSAPVDPAKMTVPAGFKKVDHPMAKMAN